MNIVGAHCEVLLKVFGILKTFLQKGLKPPEGPSVDPPEAKSIHS